MSADTLSEALNLHSLGWQVVAAPKLRVFDA